jgi:hypothetical protein
MLTHRMREEFGQSDFESCPGTTPSQNLARRVYDCDTSNTGQNHFVCQPQGLPTNLRELFDEPIGLRLHRLPHNPYSEDFEPRCIVPTSGSRD